MSDKLHSKVNRGSETFTMREARSREAKHHTKGESGKKEKTAVQEEGKLHKEKKKNKPVAAQRKEEDDKPSQATPQEDKDKRYKKGTRRTWRRIMYEEAQQAAKAARAWEASENDRAAQIPALQASGTDTYKEEDESPQEGKSLRSSEQPARFMTL